MFDMDIWSPTDLTAPTTLDLFDAFDELDRLMSRNLIWLNEPEALQSSLPKQQVHEKYRITLDCQGFNPNSIKTNIKDNKLIVNASEGKASPTEDYSFKEFRKTYELPKNIDQTKLASFVTANGQLVIEFPIKTTRGTAELQPCVVDTKEGQKKVEINAEIPENVDPNKLTVTCKDRDIIVKADYKIQKEEGGKSKVHYYRRCTLPENADLDNLKCVLENNQLTISAPMLSKEVLAKKVPIEIKSHEPIQQQQQPEQKAWQQQQQQPQQAWQQQPHIQQSQVGQQQQQEWPQKEQTQKMTSETCPTCKGPPQKMG